ncbi:hypothetical protein DFH28DRAFT_1084372 [Melampsora americana]|nr:hypothetical protein DFH28DRAFT_1084372 [Melampsora americana]
MPNTPQTSPKAGWLPIEIVSHIVQILFDQHVLEPQGAEWTVSIASDPFLDSWSTPEFLSLRLVCKTWAIAVTPICFRTVWFRDSKGAQIMIDLLKGPGSGQALDVSSLVKRLAFKDSWFLRAIGKEDLDPRLFDPLSMDQVVELIRLIGQNATELYLYVSDLIVITPALVKAVKDMKGLKKLSIEGRRDFEPYANFDAQAFSDLLAAQPKLECLILQGYNPANFTLEQTALSKLKHISLIDSVDAINIDGITQICTLAKNSLKSIELILYTAEQSLIEYPEVLEPLFKPISSTLEFLLCDTIAENIPDDTIYTEFPRLRAIYMTTYDQKVIVGDWPILRHVRTIAVSIDDGQEYWGSIINQTSHDSLPWKPPKLRLIVFTDSNNLSAKIDRIDDGLVKALKLHGIDCCILFNIQPDDLLELDFRVNGPMK